MLHLSKSASAREALDIWKRCVHARIKLCHFALAANEQTLTPDAADCRLTNGTLTDPSFPGLEHVIETVCAVDDTALVFAHAKWLLAADDSAVRIFTRSITDAGQAQFNPEEVLIYFTPVVMYLVGYWW